MAGRASGSVGPTGSQSGGWTVAGLMVGADLRRKSAADQSRVFPGEPARSLPRREGGQHSYMGQGRAAQARLWGGCVQDAGLWMRYSGVRHCAVDLSATWRQFCVVGKKS